MCFVSCRWMSTFVGPRVRLVWLLCLRPGRATKVHNVAAEIREPSDITKWSLERPGKEEPFLNSRVFPSTPWDHMDICISIDIDWSAGAVPGCIQLDSITPGEGAIFPKQHTNHRQSLRYHFIICRNLKYQSIQTTLPSSLCTHSNTTCRHAVHQVCVFLVAQQTELGTRLCD